MKLFKNLDGFVKITGSQAESFKDSFIREVVVQDPKEGLERAIALKESKDYVILIERSKGVISFEVRLETGEGPFVAFGPSLIQRYLMENTVRHLKASPPTHEYAGAGTGAH